jgi:hypothetical protein
MSESGATAASGQVRHVEHSQNHFPILQLPALPYPHAHTRARTRVRCTHARPTRRPQKVYLILRLKSFLAQAVSQSCAHSRSYLSRRCQTCARMPAAGAQRLRDGNYSDSVRDLAYEGHGTPEGLVAFSTDPCTAGYDVNFPSSLQQYANIWRPPPTRPPPTWWSPLHVSSVLHVVRGHADDAAAQLTCDENAGDGIEVLHCHAREQVPGTNFAKVAQHRFLPQSVLLFVCACARAWTGSSTGGAAPAAFSAAMIV